MRKLQNLFFVSEVGGNEVNSDSLSSLPNIPATPLEDGEDFDFQQQVVSQSPNPDESSNFQTEYDNLMLESSTNLETERQQTDDQLDKLLIDIISSSDTLLQKIQQPGFEKFVSRFSNSSFNNGKNVSTSSTETQSPEKQKNDIIQKLNILRDQSRDLYFNRKKYDTPAQAKTLLDKANIMQKDFGNIEIILKLNPNLNKDLRSKPDIARHLSAIPANISLVQQYANKILANQNVEPNPINLEVKKNQITSQINQINIDTKNLYNQYLGGKISKPQLESKFRDFQKLLEVDIIQNQLNKNGNLKHMVLLDKNTVANISSIRTRINAMLKPVSYGNSSVDNADRKPGMKTNKELLNMGRIGAINEVLNYMRKNGNCVYDNYSFSNLTRLRGSYGGQCVTFVRNNCNLGAYGFNLPGGNDRYKEKYTPVFNYGESPVPVAGSICVMPAVIKGINYGHICICLGPGSKPGTYKVAQSNWLYPEKVTIVDLPYKRGNNDPNSNYIAYASRALGRPNPSVIWELIKAGANPYIPKAGPYK